MRTFLLLFLAYCILGLPPVCNGDENVEVELAVQNLGPKTRAEDLRALDKNPRLAVELLVKQLAPCRVSKILSLEQTNYPTEMKVIWSIRALRRLTGLDFTSTLKRPLRADKQPDGAEFLYKEDNKVAFFGVWMSRDTIYLAPKNAQEDIIKHWKNWAKSELTKHPFGPPKELNSWYF